VLLRGTPPARWPLALLPIATALTLLACSGPGPDPLTDAQIESMDRSQLVREFGLRRKASSYPELSPEDEQRLKEELDKIRAKLREGRGG